MFFITGTDTNIGKTVVSAWLQLHLGYHYWKPIQCGDLDKGGDTKSVKTLTQFKEEFFYPPLYSLKAPLSPHEAAKQENIKISIEKIKNSVITSSTLIEGAGGLMVPLNKDYFMIDLIKELACPVILAVRGTLGTLNHSFLSLEALRNRNIKIAGLVICGKKSPQNRLALEEYGKAPIIGEIDFLNPLTTESLLSIVPEVKLTP